MAIEFLSFCLSAQGTVNILDSCSDSFYGYSYALFSDLSSWLHHKKKIGEIQIMQFA